MTAAITFGIILLAIGVACALIPEMLTFRNRLRRPRPEEHYVIKTPEESGPRRARPKLKREAPRTEEEEPPSA